MDLIRSDLETSIAYQLFESTELKLEVFDINGQRVATLVNEKQASGDYSVKWNGKGDNGSYLVNGLYFLSCGNQEFF
jgi:flagellar hook assembly protein FlgD